MGEAYPISRGMLLCAKPGMRRYSDFSVHCSYIYIRAGVASPNYLHAVFVHELGVTTYAAVTERRIRQAKHLIAAGELSMLEIALEVGFCSQSHFSRVFKAETGQSPTAYRRELLGQHPGGDFRRVY